MKRASPFKLPKERVLEARNLIMPEVRFVVSNYYASQDMRKRIDMQKRHQGDKPATPILDYAGESFAAIEGQIARLLEEAVSAHAPGRWMLAQYGIGPVISAGLMAHIDIDRAPTVGHIWRYAGLDPTSKWNKGEKRPWNAELKQICWHAGECFKRTSGSDRSFYGRLYQERKQYEVARNEAGHNAERVKTFVVKPGATDKTKAALAAGKLPDGQLDRQATRWATKLFLSHVHLVMYFDRNGVLPPKPYVMSQLGHAHEILPPHAELIPGLADAIKP